LYQSGALDLEHTSDGLRVMEGEFLLCVDKPVRLEIPGAVVHLGPDTVVKVSCSTNGGRLINIRDSKPDSVVMRVCKKTLSLPPGQECTFSEKEEFVAQKCCDGFGRRAAQDTSCCTFAIKTNEVGIAALLKHDPIGRHVYQSKTSADRKLKSDILKMAAALAIASKSQAPYGWE
jgi:hypothetical protein